MGLRSETESDSEHGVRLVFTTGDSDDRRCDDILKTPPYRKHSSVHSLAQFNFELFEQSMLRTRIKVKPRVQKTTAIGHASLMSRRWILRRTIQLTCCNRGFVSSAKVMARTYAVSVTLRKPCLWLRHDCHTDIHDRTPSRLSTPCSPILP